MMRNANLALTAVVILGGCAQYDVISPKEMVGHTSAMIEEHRALKRKLIRLHPYEEKIAAALIDDERVTKVRFALIVNSYDLGPRPDLVPYVLLLVVNRELDEDAVVQMIQTDSKAV